MISSTKSNAIKTNLTRVALQRTISLAVILACLYFSLGTLLAQNQVYKWVDENGVQHFSSMPPSDGEFTSVRIGRSNNTLLTGPRRDPFASTRTQQTPEPTADPQTITSPGSTVTTIDPEVIAENCERARNNIFLVNSRRRIVVNGDNGEQRRLDDDERSSLTSESQTYLDENCS